MVCFVGVNLAKLVILSFHIAVANSGLCEPFTIYCRRRVCFHCVCLNHRGCLIWVKFTKILKQEFLSQLTVANPCSVL